MVGGSRIMEIYVLDPNTLDRLATIDVYESFIWNTSYNNIGNFELHCSMKFFKILQTERVIQNTDDDKHNGLIETVYKVTKDDGSETLAIKGRMIEALLERRIVVGGAVFTSKEPGQIAAELVKTNAITSGERKIPLLEIGNVEKADEGVTDYAVGNEILLSGIQEICQNSFLGFNLRVDSDRKRYIFDTYKGANRTEEANTITHITTNNITNLLTNSSFNSGFANWEEIGNRQAFNYRTQKKFGPYPMTVSGGVVSKSRVCSIGDDGSLYDIWEPSPYLLQSVNLNSEHLYYITATVKNPTKAIISCGPKIKEGYPINFENSDQFVTANSIFVPEHTGEVPFYMGIGELAEENGQYVYLNGCALIDITQTFGVGKEPSLEWCSSNIYYDNGWKYKTQIIEFTQNSNEPLVLSRDRDTLLEVEYTKSIINECTYAYIKGDGDISTVISVGNPTALQRKERFFDLSNISRTTGSATIPQASYLAMLKNSAMATLRKLTVNEIVDGKLYLLSNKKFGKDFYLGDIVCCCDSAIGFMVNLRITAVTETWDASGYSITVTLGEDIPNIIETIKLVSKGAK